jgi:hypothetical protein
MAEEWLKEALRACRERYEASSRRELTTVLDEFCRLIGYHRKYCPPRRSRLPLNRA